MSRWLTTFLIRERGGSVFASGVVSTGYWAGITVGRFALGFATGHLFKLEKQMVLFYVAAAVVFQLLYWLLPSFSASAVAVAMLGWSIFPCRCLGRRVSRSLSSAYSFVRTGLFLRPIFPAVIVCISRLVPAGMRVTSIAVCSAVGSSGSATIPFMVGAIADARGISVLQPIVLASLGTCFGPRHLVPRLPSRPARL